MIDKGTPHGENYKLSGEGNEMPGKRAGDVVILMKLKPHERFRRNGADLYMTKHISLVEALTGVNFKVEHLDGTQITVQNAECEVIKPDDRKIIPEKGLPFY